MMLISLTACGSPAPAPAPEPEEGAEAVGAVESTYKIGVMTGTVSQGEEEFRAAENMKEMYGDMIVLSTYPDRFMQEQETTITNMMAMASDPDVKAIVMVQAVPGAAAAIARVREVNPTSCLSWAFPVKIRMLSLTTAMSSCKPMTWHAVPRLHSRRRIWAQKCWFTTPSRVTCPMKCWQPAVT
jgi:hypothetical protein